MDEPNALVRQLQDKQRYASGYRAHRDAKQHAHRERIGFTLGWQTVNRMIAAATTCPLLGANLMPSSRSRDDDAPALIMIRPELGYIEGNVVVVSALAARIYHTAPLEQLRAVVDYITRARQAAIDEEDGFAELVADADAEALRTEGKTV